MSKETQPRILMIDIETAPIQAYVWGIWDQNVGINQIIEPGYTLCWAAKWLGEPKVTFMSLPKHGKEAMVAKAHEMISEADAIIHYNGTKFDIPKLQQDFLLEGLAPASPHFNIDLLQTARSRFKFPSNKLDYVSQALGLSGKVQNRGMALWIECMAGDKQAWKEMKEYNIQDVLLLEELYAVLRPWIKNHPNLNLWNAKQTDHACPSCGSEDVQRRGYSYTKVARYQRYQCTSCGSWSKSKANDVSKEQRAATLTGV